MWNDNIWGEKKKEEETWMDCPNLSYNWHTGIIILNQKIADILPFKFYKTMIPLYYMNLSQSD